MQDDRRRGVTRDIGANDKKMKKKKLQSSVVSDFGLLHTSIYSGTSPYHWDRTY